MRHQTDLYQGQLLAPEHPLILCLHGFMGTYRDWKPVVNQLPKSQQQNVLFLNLPLDFPATLHNIQDYSDWLWQQLPEHTQPFILLGYSLGSRIAMHWLKTYPERIIGAVLEAGHPGLPGDRQRLQSDKNWQHRFSTQSLSQTLEQWYQQDVFSDVEQCRAEEVLKRYKGRERLLGRMLHILSVAKQQDLRNALGRHPVLYLSGAGDAKYQSIARELASQHTNIINQSVSGAGHNCHHHSPDEVAALVAQFLSKVLHE